MAMNVGSASSSDVRHGSKAAAWPRLPTWLAFLALFLLLTLVFSSQLYWSGYVRPWTRALGQEAIYWLAWAPLAPLVFALCRRLYSGGHAWRSYALGVLCGALLACLLHSILVLTLDSVASALLQPSPPPFWSRLPALSLRLAGINLPVYASFVLAWHASTYYSALRDRQLQALELESLLHQAQLQALRSQLNPHFLFNALHSIAELVHQNPSLAERLILRLGELLRQVLQSATLPDVPLADELAFVKGYVEIEQLRLGDRLQVSWEIEPEALTARVPSLILQPLVENAIQHGIVPAQTPATLQIRAAAVAGFLHLQVRDSGPGLASPATQRGCGIGLSNTRLRLQRLYGANHGFELSGEAGLVVDVRIPLQS